MTLWAFKTANGGASWSNASIRTSTEEGFNVGGLDHLMADILLDGTTLYIAVLDESSNPKILTMVSDLSEIAEVSYNPGAGTAINVICGDITDQIWAAGDFGSAKVVRRSDFLGLYWTDVDNSNAWTDAAGPFMIGPEADEYVLVINGDYLRETYFVGNDGPYWFTWDDNVPVKWNALDRLALYLDEVLFGAYFYYDPTAYFTPNIGLDYEDVSFSLDGKKVTSIIFGVTN